MQGSHRRQGGRGQLARPLISIPCGTPRGQRLGERCKSVAKGAKTAPQVRADSRVVKGTGSESRRPGFGSRRRRFPAPQLLPAPQERLSPASSGCCGEKTSTRVVCARVRGKLSINIPVLSQ